MTTYRYLMCPPTFFDISYIINPWMEGHIHDITSERVQQQWQALYQSLATYAQVELLTPQPGVPDLPFTANAGLPLGDRVVLSRFRYPERQREEPIFAEWFQAHGYTVYTLPSTVAFEGAGDSLFDRALPLLWGGYGFRSALPAYDYIAQWLDVEVVPLQLIDQRFYHLDTCFCPLTDGYLLYYPPAFTSESQQAIAQRVPAAKRIVVGPEDAGNFACNAVNIGTTIIINRASPLLREHLAACGFSVIETELSEFLKAGGAAKCLTLRLNEECAG